jgi:hypothetical protein
LLKPLIHRYEQYRWSQEENRRPLAFAWGLEHLGGRADEPDPRAFLERYVRQALEQSDDWYDPGAAADYRLENPDGQTGADRVLAFSSAIRSAWPENNRVWAQLFRAGKNGPAVVVLPQWNAGWEAQTGICRWLKRLGITALKMSLPYHDRRAVEGRDRDNFLVGPNIGLTLQANRQAVTDVRRSLAWLAGEGYRPLGVLGTSIGSAISFITMAHEPLVRAGAYLHASTYFGDVVRTGLTTRHVWEALAPHVSAEEIRRFWAPISPFPFVGRLRHSPPQFLLISGRYDPTFLPEFSEELFARLRADQIACEILRLPCGHYSLDRPPFRFIAGWRFATFLRRALNGQGRS